MSDKDENLFVKHYLVLRLLLHCKALFSAKTYNHTFKALFSATTTKYTL